MESFTINVYTESGEHRASGRISSIGAAGEWLATVSFCRDQKERFLVRIEDTHGVGAWMYISSPHEVSDDWIRGALARRTRARVERAQRNGAPR
jgi:hypothetical protein